MKKISILGLIFALYAGEGKWGIPGSYLTFSPTARTMALARAFTAISNDAASIFYNPAGMVQLNPQEIQITAAPLPMNGQYGWLGYVRPTKRYGSFGAQLIELSSGKIEPTNMRGERGEKDFLDVNVAFTLTYAKDLSYYLNAGLSYKLIYHQISHWSGLGQGFDIGFLLFPHEQYSFGLSAINILSPSITLIQEKEKYPLTLRLGGALKLFEDKFTLALDGMFINDYDIFDISGGLEYSPFKMLILRGGIDQTRLYGGFGTKLDMPGKTIGVDVAANYHYESSGEFPFMFFVTAYLKFAGYRTEVRPKTLVFSPRSRENNVLPIDLFATTRKKIERWQFMIKDSKGEVVRIYKDFGSPPRDLTWDGRDDLGHLVADGTYYYEFRVIEKRGSVLAEDGLLASVRTIGPKGEIFFKEKISPEKEKPKAPEVEIKEEEEKKEGEKEEQPAIKEKIGEEGEK